MKKRFLIPAAVMLLFAVGFIIYAASHPEASWPWSNGVTWLIYGLYIDAFIILLLASFWRKGAAKLRILALICCLVSVLYLVRSILSAEAGSYLTIALGLNALGSMLNVICNKREQKEKKEI